MEHTNEQNLNTERYLLNEMPAEERAAFEEHFFNCKACGEDMTAAARMFAAGHEIAVAGKNPNVYPLRRRTWWDWVPQTAAASILTALLTWFVAQPVPVPAIVAVPAESQHEIVTGPVRSAESKPEQVRVPANLTISMLYDEDVSGYYCSIRNAQGETLVKPQAVSVESSKVDYQLGRELPRGRYVVVIEGVRKTDGNRFLIARSTFEVIGER